MKVQQEPWISGEEIRDTRARLLRNGAGADDPELRALAARIDARDEDLFERYARPYLRTPPAAWIAISLDGRVLFGDTAGQVGRAARQSFGGGNFAVRRLIPAAAPEITFAP